MSIKDWPADDRPREKLIERGAASLTDTELLAIFLRVGITGHSAVDLARIALEKFGSLNGLISASREEFSQIKGFGDAKYVQLQAVVELARRALSETLRESAQLLNHPQLVKDYLRLSLAREAVEVFMVLYLNGQLQLIASEIVFRGTLDSAAVHPREIVKAVIKHHAAAIILAHNHPSGQASPSEADRQITQTLRTALNAIEVQIVDHLIVAGSAIYSFSEAGEL